MIKSHMTRSARLCILLLTVSVLFPLGLSAQEQTQTTAAETGFYYTVQKGDTLWDISQKFFSNPELWPDLWGRNQELTNPHWIYPGDLLHIYMRDGKVYVEKVDAEPKPPEPTPEPAYFLYTSIDQVGFIRKPAASPSGTVFKIQDGKEIAGTGDTLYIRQESSRGLTVGSRFVVYRTFGPVEDPSTPKSTIGTQHYFTGIAQITRQEDGYALAEVVESYRTIEVGDQVMPYEKKTPKIYLSEGTPQISGAILRSEERGELMGEHSIAFIDKGAQDGVKDGQQFRVYNQDRVRLNPEDKEMTLLPPVDIGSLLVLHTEMNNATVLVLDSRAEFGSGTGFATTLD